VNVRIGFALGAAALFGLKTPLAKVLLESVSPVMLGGCSISAAASAS